MFECVWVCLCVCVCVCVCEFVCEIYIIDVCFYLSPCVFVRVFECFEQSFFYRNRGYDSSDMRLHVCVCLCACKERERKIMC